LRGSCFPVARLPPDLNGTVVMVSTANIGLYIENILTLSPPFQSGVFEYNITVPFAITGVQLQPSVLTNVLDIITVDTGSTNNLKINTTRGDFSPTQNLLLTAPNTTNVYMRSSYDGNFTFYGQSSEVAHEKGLCLYAHSLRCAFFSYFQ
jgi:hypothetical protein